MPMPDHLAHCLPGCLRPLPPAAVAGGVAAGGKQGDQPPPLTRRAGNAIAHRLQRCVLLCSAETRRTTSPQPCGPALRSASLPGPGREPRYAVRPSHHEIGLFVPLRPPCQGAPLGSTLQRRPRQSQRPPPPPRPSSPARAHHLRPGHRRGPCSSPYYLAGRLRRRQDRRHPHPLRPRPVPSPPPEALLRRRRCRAPCLRPPPHP